MVRWEFRRSAPPRSLSRRATVATTLDAPRSYERGALKRGLSRRHYGAGVTLCAIAQGSTPRGASQPSEVVEPAHRSETSVIIRGVRIPAVYTPSLGLDRAGRVDRGGFDAKPTRRQNCAWGARVSVTLHPGAETLRRIESMARAPSLRTTTSMCLRQDREGTGPPRVRRAALS